MLRFFAVLVSVRSCGAAARLMGMKLPAALLAGLAGTTLLAVHARAMSGDGGSYATNATVATETSALVSSHEVIALDTPPTAPDAGAVKPPKPAPKPAPHPVDYCPPCGRG